MRESIPCCNILCVLVTCLVTGQSGYGYWTSMRLTSFEVPPGVSSWWGCSPLGGSWWDCKVDWALADSWCSWEAHETMSIDLSVINVSTHESHTNLMLFIPFPFPLPWGIVTLSQEPCEDDLRSWVASAWWPRWARRVDGLSVIIEWAHDVYAYNYKW